MRALRRLTQLQEGPECPTSTYWVAVKELILSYYIGGTILITLLYIPIVVTLFKFLKRSPVIG